MPTLVGHRAGRTLEVDRALVEIERDVDLLLHATPVNAAEAWEDFERGGFTAAPVLRSRELGFDPDLALRHLYDLEIEDVDEPALARLLRDKRDEIARQIALLKDRDTSRFVHGSLQLFGEVGDRLVEDAQNLLATVPAGTTTDGHVTAAGFAQAARHELDLYAQAYPGFEQTVEIREDVSDLMVHHGRLLVPSNAAFRRSRVVPLIHHEIGTHVVTYANGAVQPLKILAVGLPGYEETQEGLAVLAEFVVGGLDAGRLRLLAARVVAVRSMLDGAGFVDIFKELHEQHGFPARVAWGITIRVARSGGSTKDVIYLRGIARVLEFAAERRDLTPLFVGKLSIEHVPLIDQLLADRFLQRAWIRPRWLDVEGAAQRLARVFDGMSVLDLLPKGGSR